MYTSTGAVVVHNILGTPKDPIEKASTGVSDDNMNIFNMEGII